MRTTATATATTAATQIFVVFIWYFNFFTQLSSNSARKFEGGGKYFRHLVRFQSKRLAVSRRWCNRFRTATQCSGKLRNCWQKNNFPNVTGFPSIALLLLLLLLLLLYEHARECIIFNLLYFPPLVKTLVSFCLTFFRILFFPEKV